MRFARKCAGLRALQPRERRLTLNDEKKKRVSEDKGNTFDGIPLSVPFSTSNGLDGRMTSRSAYTGGGCTCVRGLQFANVARCNPVTT